MGFTPDNGSLIGTEGVDVLLQVNNNPAGNFIAALGDNDIISLQQTVSPGVLADYTVYGGEGNDRIDLLSSPVDTLVQGEAGNDIININTVGTVGGAIIDSSIRGGAGNDVITLVATGAGATGMVSQGGSGEDAIYASGIFGTSSIRGGQADDTIRFTTDSDFVSSQLNGGKGDDVITNDSGTLFGGARKTVAMVVSTISGNADADFIDFANNGISDLLIFGDTAGGESSDSAVGIDGDDTIISAAGDDTISGGGGADAITSFSGSDSISGGSGNDTIDSGTEDDQVFGDAGDDTIFGDEGDDTLYGNDGADSILGGSDDDLIFGNSGNDTIRGGLGGDTIDGGSGDDQIFGEEGDDTIFGDSGNDLIQGDAGADTISGGFGADNISGGTDSDIITLGDGADIVIQNTAFLNGGGTWNDDRADSQAKLSWTTGNGPDVITDFGLNDRLDVANTSFANGFGKAFDPDAALDPMFANTTWGVYGTWNAASNTFTIGAGGIGDDLLLNGASTLTEILSPPAPFFIPSVNYGSAGTSMIILDNVGTNFNPTQLA